MHTAIAGSSFPYPTNPLIVDVLRNLLTTLGIGIQALTWIWRSFLARSSLHSIPGPPPESWLKGNLGQLFNTKGLRFHQDLVDSYGGMVKVYGFFGAEQLYISDPRALQTIIVKEQDAFEETSVFLETNKVIFGPGLVATKGEQHRRQRKMTTAIFGPSQLRQIVPTLNDISLKLSHILSREINGKRTKVIDMGEWTSRIALESVGRTVLGYSLDPLDTVTNNPYTSTIKELIPTMFRLSLIRQFAPFLVRLGPAWVRRAIVEVIPHDAVQKLKRMSDTMHHKAIQILESKRRDLQYSFHSGEEEQEGRLKDIFTSLICANESVPNEEKLSDNELTGQMTVLIFGAQDTTSAALSRMLWQLSLRPDIQEMVRNEILELYDNHGTGHGTHCLKYEEITRMPWLDAVIKETLRLYPPVPFVRRIATRDCFVPYMQGDELTQVSIPSGTIIFIGIAGCNRSEMVWGSDAKEWKPERWLNDTKTMDCQQKLPGVYSNMLSFLGGQRSCVGYRFALIEMKIVLSTLLARFKFSPTKDHVVWNLSQIIGPSVRTILPNTDDQKGIVQEKKGLPLMVEELGYSG